MIMGERQLQEQLTFFQPCHCEKGIFCPGVEYDDQGYMKYHPCYHQNLGKRFTEEEKEYLCKYASDGMNSMGMALARPPKAAKPITPKFTIPALPHCTLMPRVIIEDIRHKLNIVNATFQL